MRAPAVFVLATALLFIAPREAHAQSATGDAQRSFTRGLQLYESGAYEPALAEMRVSYGAVASPNSRLYIARALRELGRLTEAIVEFEAVVREASARALTDPRFAQTQTAAELERRTLEARIGRVTVRLANAPPDARVEINGRPVPAEALGTPIPVRPGAVVVHVYAEGAPPVRRETRVEASRSETLDVNMALEAVASGPQSPSSGAATGVTDPGEQGPLARRMRTLGIASLAVGGGSLVSFAVLAIAASSLHGQLIAECGLESPCPESSRGTIETGHTLQVAANVTLGVGIFAVAAGTTLLIVGPRLRERVPRVTVGIGSLAIGGVF